MHNLNNWPFWDKCSWRLRSIVNSRKRMRKILSYNNTRQPHSLFMKNTPFFRYLRFESSLPRISCDPFVQNLKCPFLFYACKSGPSHVYFQLNKYVEIIISTLQTLYLLQIYRFLYLRWNHGDCEADGRNKGVVGPCGCVSIYLKIVHELARFGVLRIILICALTNY